MEFKKLTIREEIYAGIGLWNQENPYFQIISPLIEQNIYSPFDGVNLVAWGAYERDILKAFGLAKYPGHSLYEGADSELGWISLFVVASDISYDNEIGKELLTRLETDLFRAGVRKIRFGGDPQNFLPGLPEEMVDDYLTLLLDLGYELKGMEYDLYADIKNYQTSPAISRLSEKYGDKLMARRVSKEEENFLLDFLKENFPGRWFYEADNIRRIPGGVEDYWLLWYDGKPVGFARSNTSNSPYMGPNVNWGNRWDKKYCGLGPIGIDQKYRGLGFGLYLISKVIEDFKLSGYRHMVIDWTGLVDYYAKLGFKPVIKYHSLIHQLKQ